MLQVSSCTAQRSKSPELRARDDTQNTRTDYRSHQDTAVLRTTAQEMARDTYDTDATDDRSTSSSTDEQSSDRGGQTDTTVGSGSRRTFLKTSAAVGAGGLALGLGSNSVVAAKVQEKCNTDYGKIDVADRFTLMDNRWGMPAAQQCIWLNDDGSYGYDFDASNTGSGINYPEVFIGTRPWGDDTGVAEFPIQRRNIDELVMEIDADVTISGGEWDWAEEWWLMEQPPSQQTRTHKYEIMLLLDWSDTHNHGPVTKRNAWTDQFGTTVDHWTTYNSGGTSATFYIFRIQGGHNGGKIDMKEIVDYLSNNHGVAGDLYLSGIELGNEYWSGAVGETTYNTFNVTINGSTYTSGSSSSSDPDNSGNTGTPTDPETDPGGSNGQTLVVNDYNGSPAWPGQNDLGQWCGAGSFQNGDGEITNGALEVVYDNGGWFQEQINRDVSEYSTLVLRVKGENGGEEDEILFEMGGVHTMLSNVTGDSIGTSTSDVAIDLQAAGVDRASSALSLRLNFWQGGASTLSQRNPTRIDTD
jgi:chitinase